MESCDDSKNAHPTFQLRLPHAVCVILDSLQNAGFDAFIIGGCVRDRLLNKRVKDWDIATNATPQETIEVFSRNKDFKILDFAMRFGCIALLRDKKVFEITTFRTEGEYKDFRKPSSVSFAKTLQKDVLRRDFSINALAYTHQMGIIDYVGGLQALQKRQIACIGDANRRFGEDSLRILRAIRFCATLGFDIHPDTKTAIFANVHLLMHLSSERINSELSKMILGKYIFHVLIEFETIFQAIFEQSPQASSSHPQDHTMLFCRRDLGLIKYAPKNLVVRFVLIFGSLTKDYAASKILSKLKYPKNFQLQVLGLLEAYKQVRIFEQNGFEKLDIKRLFTALGSENLGSFYKLLGVYQKQNNLSALCSYVYAHRDSLCQVLEIKDLCINGRDLQKLGADEGKKIGKVLQTLFDEVLEEKLANTKKQLLTRAKVLLEILD